MYDQIIKVLNKAFTFKNDLISPSFLMCHVISNNFVTNIKDLFDSNKLLYSCDMKTIPPPRHVMSRV